MVRKSDRISFILHCIPAEKTHGVFKSVNKDRRPDTLVEKKYQVFFIIDSISLPISSLKFVIKVFSDNRKAGMWVKSIDSTGAESFHKLPL